MIKANRIKIVILVILIVGGFIYYNNQKKVLTIGIFAGSNWDVPTFDYYKMIDETIARFEKEHPNVEVKYQSGILKEDYSLWLSQQLLTGNEPDLYMILNEDFNSLASLGALKNLDQIIKSDDDFDVDKFYQNTLEIGKYQGNQYALPYEVNPTLMFVNKTLLEKEGVSLPENDWTLDDFYNICKQITKDTDNDGIIDQYGYYNYTWLDAIYAGGINIFNESGTSCDLNNSKVKEAVQFIEKINLLNQGFNVTSNDFDQGKVAFAPMQFSQYRTYKPYPYRVSKFSTFEWDVIEMPQQTDAYLTQLSSLMIGLSEDILKLLEEDTMGDSNIDMSVLNKVMEYPTINTGFKKYEGVMRIVDNQITKTLQNNADLDTALIALQREINNYLNE